MQEIAQNEDLPLEVRAAAQYFVVNGEVWTEVPAYPTWPATSEDFDNFVATNAALAVFAQSYARFDVADDEDGEPDGYV